MKLHRAAAGALAAVAGVAVATGAVPAAAKVKPNSENNGRLGPGDSVGEFLGYPTATYQWHGCKLTSVWVTPRGLPQGAPEQGNGSKQAAVTFTYNNVAPPYISWQVKSPYKICGVQVSAELGSPDVDSLLLGQAGYTSGKLKGSSSKTGRETIKVKIPKNSIGSGFEQYEGKTFGISEIDAVTVFVKKR